MSLCVWCVEPVLWERGNWNPLSWSFEGGPAISPACFSISSFFISACLFLVPLYSWLSFFPFVFVIPPLPWFFFLVCVSAQSSPFKTKTMVVKARGFAAGWGTKIFPGSVFFFPLCFLPSLALSHLLWLYSQRIPTIWNGFKAITARNGSWGRRWRRRWTASQNGAVCAMEMTIFNLVTAFLKSCNQAPF